MDNLYDLIILGGGPSGASAGIYAGRAKLKALIIDKEDVGGQIKITSEVVNYPGIVHTSGTELMEEMRKQVKSFGVEFISAEINDMELDSDIKTIKTNKGEFRALGVIVALGSRPRTLGFEGEDLYTGRGIGYCATCDGEFFAGMDIFVIGGGFAAAEEAIFLTRYAKKVHVIVMESEFTCSKTIADKVLKNDKIEVHFNMEIKSVKGENVLKEATFINNKTNEIWNYKVENETDSFGIFVFIGYEPMTKLLKDKITLDKAGYIITNEDLETNVSGVFAAGDIRPKKLRQLVTAVSDGAIAATNIEKYIEEKRNELGIKREEVSSPPKNKSFLDEDLKNQLLGIFDRFETPIYLKAVLNDSELSSEISSFLDEIKVLTDKIKIITFKENEVSDETLKSQYYPVVKIFDKDDKYTGISYHGVPGGHEFNSFVIALYNISGPGQQIEDDILKSITGVKEKINIKVGATLACTMCPEVVQGSQLIAAKNPLVEAEMIDVSKYPEFKTKYNIMSVPAIIINDSDVFFGKKNVLQLLELLKK